MANSDKWKALARYLSCENVPRKPRCGPALDKIYGQNPCIVVILGHVHTNAFSFENGYNMMRLSLCPHINTLSVFNENASIWKRYWKWMKTTTLTLVWLVWTVENESNENDDRARSMRLEFNLRHRNVQFYRFRVDSRKRIKTVEWKRIYRSVFNDNENAYFWKRVTVDRALFTPMHRLNKDECP